MKVRTNKMAEYQFADDNGNIIQEDYSQSTKVEIDVIERYIREGLNEFPISFNISKVDGIKDVLLIKYFQVSSQYINWIIGFLKMYPQIYNVLDDSLKTLISSSISELNQFMMCDFLSANIEEHYKIVLYRLNSETLSISQEDLRYCFEKAKEKGVIDKFFEICIKVYSKSSNYDCADANYYQYISPFLSDYTLNDILLLMRETNEKSQVCNRNRAYFDHKNVIQKFYNLGGRVELFEGLKNWENWNTSMLFESMENT